MELCGDGWPGPEVRYVCQLAADAAVDISVSVCYRRSSANSTISTFRGPCNKFTIRLKRCNFRFRLAAGGLGVLLQPIIDQLFNYVTDDGCCVACKWAAVI